MVYVVFLVCTLIGIISLGIYKKHGAVNPKKYLKTVAIYGIPISLLSGALEGSWYSHGFDVHWWMFSIFFFIIIYTVALLLVLIMYIIPFKAKK